MSGILVAIDFEKAFDSLDHAYLFKVLNAFNFGPSFIQWIRTRPVARIFYGWVRSVDYTDQRAPEALFTRGVRGHAPPGNFEN